MVTNAALMGESKIENHDRQVTREREMEHENVRNSMNHGLRGVQKATERTSTTHLSKSLVSR